MFEPLAPVAVLAVAGCAAIQRPATRVGAIGLGSRRPLLDNGDAENHADDLRVELIVQRVQLSGR